jgi:hypothetical protein
MIQDSICKVPYGNKIKYDKDRIKVELNGLYILDPVSFKIQNRSMIAFEMVRLMASTSPQFIKMQTRLKRLRTILPSQRE